MVVELYDTERSYVEALQILVNVSTQKTIIARGYILYHSMINLCFECVIKTRRFIFHASLLNYIYL